MGVKRYSVDGKEMVAAEDYDVLRGILDRLVASDTSTEIGRFITGRSAAEAAREYVELRKKVLADLYPTDTMIRGVRARLAYRLEINADPISDEDLIVALGAYTAMFTRVIDLEAKLAKTEKTVRLQCELCGGVTTVKLPWTGRPQGPQCSCNPNTWGNWRRVKDEEGGQT